MDVIAIIFLDISVPSLIVLFTLFKAVHVVKKPRTTKSTAASKASTAKAQKKVVGKKGDLKWVMFDAGRSPALSFPSSVSDAGCPEKQKWLPNQG